MSPNPTVLDAEAIRSRRLDNGLKVLVLADDLVPAIAYQTTWRVGSRNERPGITGISHLFEHMMFNGARKYGPKMFDQVIEGNGGTSNAYTTQDVTAYHEVMPCDALGVVLDLERDRMADLDLTERNLGAEREVVKEERRMRVDDSPAGVLHEQLLALAFLAHPYRWPVIGWMADIEAMSVEDINDYFRVHYTPGNATVSLCGAVDPDRALDEIEAALGDLPPGPEQPPVVRSEPPQLGERRAVVRKDSQLALVAMAFHAPDARSADCPALDVAQTILTHGDSSRLQRRLVLDEALAVDVGLDFPWTIDPGVFAGHLTVRPGVEAARAEAALIEELERIASDGVSEPELRKAKNQLQADHWRMLKTNDGRADLLGSFEVLCGDAAGLFELPGRYEAVTADDIRRVAADVFRPENRTVVTLVPRGDSAVEAE